MQWTTVVIALCALAGPAAADPRPADLSRLFPHEAAIFVERPGLSRLVVPPEVLRACRPDLSDVRIFDREGHEVPFLADSGVAQDDAREAAATVAAKVIDVRRDPVANAEVYDLAVPDPPLLGGNRWRMVIGSASQSEFERVVEINGTQSDGVVVSLVPQASLFRLPRMSAEQTRFELPPFSGERITVIITGGHGGFLNPTISFESIRRFEATERATVPLEEISRQSGGGKTVIDLVRPSGIVPDRVRLETGTSAFSRCVRVADVSATGHERELGQANLFRVPADPVLEDRELHVTPARGERLRIEIVDQDSPALSDLSVVAVVQQPVLIFALTPPSDASEAATLRFGGGRAGHPRYDLAGLLPSAGRVVTGTPARVAAWLYDPQDLGSARLGSIQANTAFDKTPVLAFAMQPGSEITAGAFAYRRPLSVTPSPEGLSKLRLSAEDEAAARADLADLRIIDAHARQWPYLLERNVRTEPIELSAAKPTQREHTSQYSLRLPASPLRIDQLALDIDAPYAHRPYRLAATGAHGSEKLLAEGQLVKSHDQPGPVTIPFAATTVEGLELRVDDGDDAPLRVRVARARRLVSELYLTAPAGEYFLLVGNPDAVAPHYELGAVRDVVLAVSSAPIGAGAFAHNPTYSLRARLSTGGRPMVLLQQAGLWAVLVLAVIVLTLLTLRLVRREPTLPPRKDG